MFAHQRRVDRLAGRDDVAAIDVAEIQCGVEIAGDGAGEIVLRRSDGSAVDSVPGV